MRAVFFSLGLFILGLLQRTLSTITPQQYIPSYTLGYKDKIVVMMNRLFQMSNSSATTFTTDNPQFPIYNYTTPFWTQSIQQLGINTISQVIDLTNGVVGIIYNTKSAAFITFTKDGKGISKITSYTDANIGVTVTCDDMILNTNTGRVYMSCHSNDASSQEPGSSYIYDIDYQTGNLNTKVVIDQSDGYYVELASRMRIVDLVQGSGVMRILIFYSQALSGSLGLQANYFFRYFTNIDAGNLVFNPQNVIDFTQTNLGFRVFYDLNQYQNELILSGKITGVNQTILKACYLDSNAVEMMCRPQYQSTNIVQGFAGLVKQDYYVEVDMLSNYTALCGLSGDFNDPNWRRCRYNDSILTFGLGTAFIKDVEIDNSVIMIEFVHPDGSYLGYSTHVVRTGLNSIHADQYGTLSEDRLVYIPLANPNTISLVWLVPNFMWIDANKFQGGYKIIVKVTAYDPDTPQGVTVNVNINIQDSYIGVPSMTSTFKWPSIDVLQGSYYAWPVGFWDVQGNGLSFDLQFSPQAVSELFEVHVYHTNMIDLNFISDDPMNANLKQVVTGDNFAIGIDTNNVMVFYACKFEGIAAARCVAKQTTYVGPNATLSTKAVTVNGMAFCWVTWKQSPITTSFFLFDGENYGNYSVKSFAVTDADAFAGQNSDGRTVGYIAFGRSDRVSYVQLMTFEIGSVDSIRMLSQLTADNTLDGFLCPTKVQGNSRGGSLTIVSNCYTEMFSDSRIIVFRFPGPYNILEKPLSSNGSLSNPTACYFGDTLLIGGNGPQGNYVLFMTDGQQDDPSEEYFGLDEYDLANVKSISCSEENLMFSVYSSSSTSNGINIGTFYGTTRLQASKRCHSVMKNLNITTASASYGLEHALMHVMYDRNNNAFFALSYILGPIIYTDISFASPLEKKNYENHRLFNSLKLKDTVQYPTVTLLVTDAAGHTMSNPPSTSFSLRNQDTNIKIMVQNAPKEGVGNYNLDTNAIITGPVFRARINNNNGKFQLTQRIEYVQGLERHGGAVYNIIKESAQRTYAVDVDNDYTTVDFFTDGDYIKTLSGLGKGAFYDFEVVNVDYNRGSDMLIYALHTNGQDTLFVSIYTNGTRTNSKIASQRIHGRNLEAVYADSGSVYVFAHDQGRISFYQVQFNPTTLADVQINHIEEFTNFNDFTVFRRANLIYVVGYGFEGNDLSVYTVQNTGANPAISGPFYVDLPFNFRLWGVKCKAYDSQGFFCIMNTDSSFISEAYITYNSYNVQSTGLHDKYGYLEAFDIDFAGNYIYAFARTTKPGVFSLAILCWKTFISGGNGPLWYGVNLPVPDDMDVDIHYRVPFAVTEDHYSGEKGDAWLTVGTLSDGVPIAFFHTSTFKLNVTDGTVDLTQYDLVFEGLTTQTISLSNFFTLNTQASSWVPFAVMIGVLVLLAVLWFIYVRIKSDMQRAKDENPESKYRSVASKPPQGTSLAQPEL
jgi:hypothetical protein